MKLSSKRPLGMGFIPNIDHKQSVIEVPVSIASGGGIAAFTICTGATDPPLLIDAGRKLYSMSYTKGVTVGRRLYAAFWNFRFNTVSTPAAGSGAVNIIHTANSAAQTKAVQSWSSVTPTAGDQYGGVHVFEADGNTNIQASVTVTTGFATSGNGTLSVMIVRLW